MSQRTDYFSRAVRLQKILAKTMAARPLLAKTKSFADVRPICIDWSKTLNDLMGVDLTVTGTPFTSEPCLYVSNHISYLDITVLMSMLPLTFVAKKEVSKYPFFGQSATDAGTVYIDRSSSSSRMSVSKIIGEAITTEKKSIGLFPEGTSSMEGRPWKKGAFTIAKSFGFKVQVLRIGYRPLRKVAFIDDDSMGPHLWGLLGAGHIETSVEFFDPIEVTNPDVDCATLQAKVQGSLSEWLKTRK